MFHDVPEAILKRMAELEEIDARDRKDGTERLARLRQVPRDVGKFVAILAAGAPPGRWVEIGTSAGYSTLWLALACREADRRVTTFEVLDAKAALARETFALTGVDDVVDFVPGGLLVADNAVGFEDVMQPMLDRALTDARVDAVIVRFLTGQLICRKR